VTTADADQATVAAFRPWRVSQARIPWALTRTILPPPELRGKQNQGKLFANPR